MKWVSYASLAIGLALLAGCTTPEPENTASNTPPPPQASANTPPPAPAANTPPETPAAVTPTEKPGGASSGPPAKPAKVAPAKYKTLPGGLKYAILKPGTGPAVQSGQTAVMN